MEEQYFDKERLPPLSPTPPITVDPFSEELDGFGYLGTARNVLSEDSLWENIAPIEFPHETMSNNTGDLLVHHTPSPDALQCTWVAYQSSRAYTTDCDGEQSLKKVVRTDEPLSYEEQLSVFGTFDTYTGFAEIWNKLHGEERGFQLFKTGIKPVWEAEENKDGGKFYIVNGEALPKWVPFALARAVVLGKLPFYDNINGLAFSYCSGVWYPHIWCTSAITNGPINDTIVSIKDSLSTAEECKKDEVTGLIIRFKKHPIPMTIKNENHQESKERKQNTKSQTNLLFFSPSSFQQITTKRQPQKCMSQSKKQSTKPYELRYSTSPHHGHVTEHTQNQTNGSPITTTFATITHTSTKPRKESPQTFDFSNTNFVFRPSFYSKTDIDVPSVKESSDDQHKARPRRASFSSSSSNMSEEAWTTEDDAPFIPQHTSNEKHTPMIDIDENTLLQVSKEKDKNTQRDTFSTDITSNEQQLESKQKRQLERKKLANRLSVFASIDSEMSSQTYSEQQTYAKSLIHISIFLLI